jgi:hypothetical protein
VSESEALGLMLPAVPLRRIAGESHVLRFGGSHDARSLTKQWLTDGYFGCAITRGIERADLDERFLEHVALALA